MIFVVTLSLLLIFPWYAIGTKVFTFHEGLSDPDELSSATLTNAPDAPLPDHFIICSSHKQQQVDTANTNTVFVLYEDNSFTKPWFSIGFYKDNKLWTNTRYISWQYHDSVTRETLLQWIHICVEVDTINGTLRASVNGGNVTTVNNVEGLTPVPKLHLRLGVVHQSEDLGQFQFFGSVTNINIFTVKHRGNKNVLLSPVFVQNLTTFISWPKTIWNVVGEAVEKKEIDMKIIFTQSKEINFRIPLSWNKFEAMEECRKYGNANISTPPSLNMTNVTKLELENIYGENHEECTYFWTPFTDKYSEGYFVDEVTNETIGYLYF